uniref:WW domain-binding protein 11 n=1 Tax=Haemonchus contortus TaxID=6289 RepID=A0A7I4Y4C9_HAECO|nr:WW domain-binding protein 11 [Haemonchus contortus]
MPSAAKTKSGRIFRAPTDQARKLERRRENKKNKRDRQQIRQTIAKCYDVDDSTSKMLAIERQILGLDKPQFHVDVLKKKQRTIMEMVNKRRAVLQTLKEEKELKELNEKLHHYYSDCKKLQALAEQERLARNADVNFIPLPEGDLAEGELRKVQIMGPQPMAPVKKKVEFKLPRGGPRRQGLRPPGPPCGIPPDLSDSEGEGENDHDPYHVPLPADDDLAPVIIPDFDAPNKFPKFSNAIPLRQPPGPLPIPVPPRFNPMGIPIPPMPGPAPAPLTQNDGGGAVISSAPVIRRDREQPPVIGPQAPTTVSAAPQLRNLRKETVKLVPVVLKRKPTGVRPKPTIRRPQTEATQQAKTTDEAYNEFMKEMADLI